MYYQHYKGGKYLFIHEARHSETLEKLIVYKSMQDGKVWVRPADLFFGKVIVNGEVIRRFRPYGLATHETQREVLGEDKYKEIQEANGFASRQ